MPQLSLANGIFQSRARDLSHPAKLGVPTYFGIPSGGVQDYENWRVVENGKATQSTTYVTSAITDYAINWIEDQNQPWFLWLAYTAPHTPFHAPPEALHSFGNLSENTATIRRDPRKHYFAALEALDSELGRLLNSLSPAERRDTVVLFTGDNGSPRQITRRLNTQREAKGTIYNGGTQVPMVIVGPGVLKGRFKQPVLVTDLFDTILTLTGTGGHTKDSHDLTPSLNGNATTREAVYIEHFSSREGRGRPVYGWAMISEDYSLIAPENASMELYKSSDKTQRKNAISAAKSEADSLLALRDTILD